MLLRDGELRNREDNVLPHHCCQGWPHPACLGSNTCWQPCLLRNTSISSFQGKCINSLNRSYISKWQKKEL